MSLKPGTIYSSLKLQKPLLLILICFVILTGLSATFKDGPIKVMLLTGVSAKYHSWEVTSTVIKRHLDAAGIFETDVIVCPEDAKGKASFNPKWKDYDVVVMVYDDGNWARPEQDRSEWSDATKLAFDEYVRQGGGLVVQHATDNCFPTWQPFNEMIGVGGWGGRNEQSGPWLVWKNGKIIKKTDKGGASHPPKHDFHINVRDDSHPIMKDMPTTWLHPKDEIYSHLTGPAKKVNILATAYSDPAKSGGSGEHEPMAMTIKYGKGRVFHTTLGHVGPKDQEPIAAVNCVGFITLMQRGTEWAATGKVTLPIPKDFPTKDKVVTRAK